MKKCILLHINDFQRAQWLVLASILFLCVPGLPLWGAGRRIPVALKPDDVNAHWRLGRLYRSIGKTTEAQTEFDKSKSLNKSADEGLLKVMQKVPHPAGSPQGAESAPTEK